MCPIIEADVVATSGTSSPTATGLTSATGASTGQIRTTVIDTHSLATYSFHVYVKFEGGATHWTSRTIYVVCGPGSTTTTMTGSITSPQSFEVTKTKAGDRNILFSVPKSLFASDNPVCPVSGFTVAASKS